MTRNLKILSVIFLVIVSIAFQHSGFAQKRMSKKEIYLEWKRTDKLIQKRLEKEYGDQLKKLPFQPKVVAFIDSLNECGVDTIGVLSQCAVGYLSIDSCDSGTSPWDSYVQWKKDGAAFHRTIRQNCSYRTHSIPYSTIIDYYACCPKELKAEEIIPVLIGGRINKKGEFIIESSIVDHTIHYTIYCRRGNDSILKRFTEYDLEEKQNLFYEENQHSRIRSWWDMIFNQIQEINTN